MPARTRPRAGAPRASRQFRGSPLLDWEENLPSVPDAVLRVHASYVAEQLVMSVGGSVRSLV